MAEELTVLIAEDELLIRMGIKLSCDWAAQGMRVVDDAADGLSAWESYQRLKPDVLLVDIRMPGISGVELARRVREKDSACRIIAITCVDEFDTLHQLTHYGITDYLLKADMTLDTLSAVLKKARQEWESLHLDWQSASDRNAPDKRSPAPNEPEPAFIPRYIIALYSEQFTNDTSLMVLPTFERMLSEQLSGLADMPRHVVCTPRGAGKAVCLIGAYDGAEVLSEDDSPTLDARMQECLERLRVHFERMFGAPLTLLGGKLAPGEDAESACARMDGIYDGGYWFAQAAARWEPDDAWLRRQKEDGVNLFLTRDTELDGPFKAVYPILAQKAPLLPTDSVKAWRDALIGLASYIMLQALRLSSADISQLTTALLAAPTAYASLEACIQAIENIAYRTLTANVRRPEICKALDYISRNFQRNISYGDVAEQVGLSPHYFLNVFKRETGMTFVGCLNHCRIERAKQLLEDTNLYAYEIADKCGFSDAAYFSRMFKQITGVHPSCYRQAGDGRGPDSGRGPDAYPTRNRAENDKQCR